MFKLIGKKLYTILCSNILFVKYISYGYANYANKIVCISDHEKKGLCLSFYLVPILVVVET